MLLIPGILASKFQAVQGDFESIATVVVGSGGSTSIDFTSIPGTYQHLQIRGILRDNSASSGEVAGSIQLNGVTTSSYASHILLGDGSSAAALAYSSQTSMTQSLVLPGGGNTAGRFGACVIDILDYANTNKNTTLRILVGVDLNGGGQVRLTSGLFNNTAAVTSVKLITSNNFAQYSHFALYGIKG